LRRPAFFLTESNRRAEELAESVRFFAQIFPGVTGGVALLPAFDNLPWDSQPPHADILERRAATLYRLANGEVSLVIAPMAAALWRYQDPYVYLTLSQILAKDSEVSHDALIKHLGSIGYARTEMVDLPGQFAVRGGIIDVFSPEALRPVRIELLGDTVESVREFDPRTQRSGRAGEQNHHPAARGMERPRPRQPGSRRVGAGTLDGRHPGSRRQRPL